MNTNIPLCHFDRGKPFYPIVMNYVILLGGYKELTLRAVLQALSNALSRDWLGQVRFIRHVVEIKLNDNIVKLIEPSSSEADLADILDRLESKLSGEQLDVSRPSLGELIRQTRDGLDKLSGIMKLKSEFQDNFIEADLDEISQEIINNSSTILEFTVRSAGSILILAYETTYPFHDTGPLWEFLRHCRNAAAHNGLFHFEHGEPRRPAEWGKFRLDATMNGTPLFKKGEAFPGLLFIGDPIRLLWDIEQAYPNMVV